MQNSHLALGTAGEDYAARHLAAHGWRILERNARCDGVEIDLVASRAGVLAFVEVKTRRTHAAGVPEEAVDARKRSRLVRGAAAWLRDHRARTRSVRFDVLIVEPDVEGWRCRHLPGAFDAGD